MNAQVIGLIPPLANNLAVQTTPLDVSRNPYADSFRSKQSEAGTSVETEQPPRIHQKVSKEELAEMVAKVNLSYDPFEIEAKFTMSKQGQRVIVTLRNTRTGEIIRKIPPDDFASKFEESAGELGLWINRKV